VAGALFLLSGRWKLASLFGPDLADPPFYYEVRFWAVLALSSGLLVMPLNTRRRLRGRFVVFPLLIFFGYTALSSAWAPDPTFAWQKLYDVILVAVATASIARIVGAGAADAFAEGLWGGMLVFGGVLAWIALAAIGVPGGSDRLAVLGGGPNVFGRMMGYLAFAALFFWRRQGRMWLYLPVSVLAVFLTLLSGSRGSLVGLAAGCLAFFLLEIRRPGRLFIAAVAGAVLFFLLVEETEVGRTAIDRFYTRVQVQLVEQRYASGRQDIYREAFELGRASPVFGAGLAAFPALGLGAYPHNFFLEAFCETGLVGLALLAGACGWGILNGLARRQVPDGVTAGAFVLILVASQFSGGLYDSRGVFALLIAALGIPAVSEDVRDRRERRAVALGATAATIPKTLGETTRVTGRYPNGTRPPLHPEPEHSAPTPL